MQVAAIREPLEKHRSLQAEKYKEFVGNSDGIHNIFFFSIDFAMLVSLSFFMISLFSQRAT